MKYAEQGSTTILRHLLPVILGWATAAILEAASYLALAWAVVHQQTSGSLLALALLTLLVTVLVSRAGFWAGARLAGDLYASLANTMRHAKLSWFSATNRTLLNEVATRNIPGFMSIPAHQIQLYVHTPLIPLCLTLGVGLIAGLAAMVTLGGLLLLSLFIQIKAQQSLRQADKQRNTGELAAHQATHELIEHLELLRTSTGQTHATDRLESKWQAQEKALARTNVAASIATLMSGIAALLPVAGMAIYLLFSDTQQSAIMLALLLLTLRSAAPLESLAIAGISMNDQLATIKHYRQAADAPRLAQLPPWQQTHPANHTIALDKLGLPLSQQSISAIIKPGQRWLINGTSGSGKTTLLHLLMRFDDPPQGQISLGGAALDAIPQPELNKHYAYVPQDPLIFTGTLASNIRIGKPDASDKEMESIARQLRLGDVLDRSEQGIHQQVGLQGAALSGGERQRLALARALIKNAPILVLDEATSALDYQTEQQVINYILTQHSTLIVVAHNNQNLWQATDVLNLAK